MPLHVYHCTACESDHELLVHASESTPPCPACGADALARQFATFAVGSSTGPAPQMAPCQQMGGCPGGVCPMMN